MAELPVVSKKTQTNSRPAWAATSRCRWLNNLEGISGQPDGLCSAISRSSVDWAV